MNTCKFLSTLNNYHRYPETVTVSTAHWCGKHSVTHYNTAQYSTDLNNSDILSRLYLTCGKVKYD